MSIIGVGPGPFAAGVGGIRPFTPITPENTRTCWATAEEMAQLPLHPGVAEGT